MTVLKCVRQVSLALLLAGSVAGVGPMASGLLGQHAATPVVWADDAVDGAAPPEATTPTPDPVVAVDGADAEG